MKLAECAIPTTLKNDEKIMFFKGLVQISHAWDTRISQGIAA